MPHPAWIHRYPVIEAMLQRDDDELVYGVEDADQDAVTAADLERTPHPDLSPDFDAWMRRLPWGRVTN